jgi:iron complex outermembrane receptor protein
VVALAGGTSTVRAQSGPSAEPQSDTSAQADAGANLEQLLSMEIQSVFGASRFIQKSTEAPAAVTVVTADDIWRYGWRTLADVMRSVRGFYVNDDRAWAYVGISGFQRTGDYNTRVLLLVDGRRTNDNTYDQALIQEDFLVDMADVERIEFIRGPSSSLYGSNAFFGVVNVVTRSATVERPPTLSLDLGTLGLWTERVSLGRQVNDDVAIRLSASLQRRAGLTNFYTPEFDDGGPGSGVAHELDYTDRQNVLLRATYKQVDFSGGFNLRKRGLPTGAYSVALDHPDTWVEDQRAYVDAHWQGLVGRNWEADVRGTYDQARYVGSYPYVMSDVPGDIATNFDTGRGQWLTGNAMVSRRVGASHRVTIGAERRQHLQQRMLNYYDGQAPLLDVNRRAQTSAAYAQDEWRLHRSVLVNAGVRYDHYSSFRDPIKPRAAFIYQPKPRTAVKLLYGEAFRAPNVYETDYAFADSYLPNPNLSPEETRRVETLVEHYAGSHVRLAGSWFRYAVSDLIDQRFDEELAATYYDNIAAVRAVGFDAEAEAKWPSGWQVLGSYTYSRAKDLTTDERLTNSPAHVTQFRASAPLWARTMVALDMRALSARRTPRGTSVGAYVVPNITVSRAIAGRGLSVALTVANLTNTRYADPVSTDFVQDAVVQDGRTARLRLSWSF